MLVYEKITIYLMHKPSGKEKAAIFLICMRWYTSLSRVNVCKIRMCSAKQRNNLHVTKMRVVTFGKLWYIMKSVEHYVTFKIKKFR